MGAELGEWSKDKNGSAVDWTAPPYFVRGVLCVLLEGETAIAVSVEGKRMGEYFALVRGHVRMIAGTPTPVPRDPNAPAYRPARWATFFQPCAEVVEDPAQ